MTKSEKKKILLVSVISEEKYSCVLVHPVVRISAVIFWFLWQNVTASRQSGVAGQSEEPLPS